MYQSVIPKILEKYQLDYAEILEVQKGYRNESYPVQLTNGQMINVICYKRDPEILNKVNRADTLAQVSSDTGLPIRVRHDNRLLKITEGKYAGVYNYLPGQTIAWEAYTKKHTKLLGWALASFHRSVRDHRGDFPHADQQLTQIFEKIEAYFANPRVLQAVERKLGLKLNIDFNNIYHFLELCGDLPDQQPLHLDFVRGNVLFRTKEPNDTFTIGNLALSGIIDLEKTAKGHKFFDIARTLAFLLVDCPKPANKIYKYFLDSGYQKRGQTTIQPIAVGGKDLLEQLINIYLIYDFYKFLQQNPYESLVNNHHYQNTCDQLIKRGALRQSGSDR